MVVLNVQLTSMTENHLAHQNPLYNRALALGGFKNGVVDQTLSKKRYLCVLAHVCTDVVDEDNDRVNQREAAKKRCPSGTSFFLYLDCLVKPIMSFRGTACDVRGISK